MRSINLKPHGDYYLLVLVLLLCLLGVLAVYDASVVYAYDVFGGKYHFLLLQLAWVAIGLTVMTMAARLNLSTWRRLAGPLFLAALAFLILVLLPTPFAPQLYGARRWLLINPAPLPVLPIIGRLGFQPTELAKLAWILYLAAILAREEKSRKEAKVTPLLGSLLLLLVLVVAQPDLGSGLLLAGLGGAVYFISGAPLARILLIASSLGTGGLLLTVFSPYRRQRLLTFLKPGEADPLRAGYHLRQILIALGSGGWWGIGLGQSRQKYGYLPEVASDSIFAVIGEETGFLGAVILIVIYLMLIWRLFYLTAHTKNPFGRLVVGGVTFWVAWQTLINLAAMVSLIPLTGVPLPLVSYGGSSLIFMMVALGLVLNISRGDN